MTRRWMIEEMTRKRIKGRRIRRKRMTSRRMTRGE